MVKKLFGYSMATWLGALLTFVLVPIASQLYEEYDLGVINYYYSIVNIIFTFIVLGLDQAYLRFYSEYDSSQRKIRFTNNILVTVGAILGLGILCAPFSKFIVHWLVDETVSQIIPILVLHLIGLTVTRYFVILFRLKSKFIEYTILSVINTILLKSVYLLGYPLGGNARSGILVTAGVSIAAALLISMLRKSEFSIQKGTMWDEMAKNEFLYALPLVPTMLFAVLNNYIPQIVLRTKTDFSNIAVYSIGVTLASVITLLHNGLNTFLEPYIFSNYQTKRDQIAKILDAFTVVAYIVCMLVILFQNVFFFFFKRSYIISTVFLPLLLTSSLWYTIGDFYNIGVKIGKRTSENISIYIVGFLLNTGLSFLLIPKLGCLGAAISAASASGFMAILKTVKGNKYYRILDSYKNVLLGAVILVAVDISNVLLWDSHAKYGIVIAGILLYAVLTGAIKDASLAMKRLLGQRQCD